MTPALTIHRSVEEYLGKPVVVPESCSACGKVRGICECRCSICGQGGPIAWSDWMGPRESAVWVDVCCVCAEADDE